MFVDSLGDLKVSIDSEFDGGCGVISGGVDASKGEKVEVKLELFDLAKLGAFACPVKPKPDEGGGEKNRGGGGEDAKYCEGEVTSLVSRRIPLMAFMSIDSMPAEECRAKASCKLEKEPDPKDCKPC